MQKHLTAFILFLSCLSSAVWAQQPVKRIISLAPHATELAFAAGLGDKIVAVSDHSDYPPAAQKLEAVSSYQGINIERIIALQPDLIIAWPAGNPIRELEKLKQFGLSIYYTQTDSLEDIAENIEQLSQYADDPTIGHQAASDFRIKLDELKKKYATDDKVKYFYQLAEKPVITLAKGKWPSEVFEFCGGENIFADSSAPYPKVGIEQVILRDPEVIFTSEHAIKNGTMWQSWQKQLTAVKNGYVWSLNSDWINRPTPRTLNAITEVCEHFKKVRENR